MLATPAQHNWLSLDITCRRCFIPLKLLCGPFPMSADMNSSSQIYIPPLFFFFDVPTQFFTDGIERVSSVVLFSFVGSAEISVITDI